MDKLDCGPPGACKLVWPAGVGTILPDPRRILASGLTVNIHKLPTRSGKTVVSLNLSDETGIMDAVLFEDIYRRGGAELSKGGHVIIDGWMEMERGKNLIASAVRAIPR